MSGTIFLVQDSGDLVEMTEQQYDSEEILQSILEKYPKLIAGDQINSSAPRQWLFVSRESSVPGEEGGMGRWSVDHLFLDQDGIPTLIEVKRSTDTRIRREVVGQMLDYAANAVLYWHVEEIRNQFEKHCRQRGNDPEERLQRFLGPGMDPAVYWEKVKTNLEAEKIRLIFVADIIPQELQRIVEFLNGQMERAEVLALEIKQYSGSGQTTLVPKIIGQTIDAQTAKSRGIQRSSRDWDEASFLSELLSRTDEENVEIARKILQWAKSKSLLIKWGTGGREGTFYPCLNAQGEHKKLFGVYSVGRVEITFRYYPLATPEQRAELFRRMRGLKGVSWPDKIKDSWGGFPLSSLVGGQLNEFLDIIEWVLSELDKAP